MSTVTGNEQFLLPITKNRIKAIDNMEKEFYKTQREINKIIEVSGGSPKSSTADVSSEKELTLYKRQAKYYKNLWLAQKKEIEELSEETRKLRDISSILVKSLGQN